MAKSDDTRFSGNLGMEHAEVFATVYAAWNNLLMDGLTPTDEQIVLCERSTSIS